MVVLLVRCVEVGAALAGTVTCFEIIRNNSNVSFPLQLKVTG